MESIKELRKICQKHVDYGTFGEELFNKFSIYLTKLLLFTSISSNQVTIIGEIIGLIGIFFITSTNFIIVIGGYLLILFYYLTDFCDGEVSRYKHQSSLKGGYLDAIGHIIIYPLMFIAIGINLFNQSSSIYDLLLGSLTTIFFFFCFSNEKTFRIITKEKKQLYTEHYSKYHTKTLKWYLLKFHKKLTYNIHVVLYFLCFEVLGLMLKLFQKEIKLTRYLLLFYGILFLITFFLQILFYSKDLNLKDQKLIEK